MSTISTESGPTPAQQAVITNLAIKAAKDLPSLVANLQQVDPGLVQAFTGKALLASKSVYGPLVATVVTHLSTKYGLGWDSGTCELADGVVILAASAVCRLLTKCPITGLFRKKVLPAPTK